MRRLLFVGVTQGVTHTQGVTQGQVYTLDNNVCFTVGCLILLRARFGIGESGVARASSRFEAELRGNRLLKRRLILL